MASLARYRLSAGIIPAKSRYLAIGSRAAPRIADVATQSERRTATRRLLIDAARQCFAADGYEDTSTEQIRTAAGVSRGAMYHHFASKRAIFEAVFVQVSNETIERSLRDTGRQPSALEDLIAACLAWLREVQHPEATAILIEQGPHVLGWKRARDLEAATSLDLMSNALERAAAAGEIEVDSIPVTARLLNAVLAEAALTAVDFSGSPSQIDLERSVRQFIEGLHAPAP